MWWLFSFVPRRTRSNTTEEKAVLSRIVWTLGLIGVSLTSWVDDLRVWIDERSDRDRRRPVASMLRQENPLGAYGPDAQAQPSGQAPLDVVSLREAAEELGCTEAQLIGFMVEDGLLIAVPDEPGRFVPSPHPDIQPLTN
jgi:hypothetical protein